MNAIKTALAQLEAAAAAGKLSASAAENIRTWLTQPYLRDYAAGVADHVAAEKWMELEDAFWTTIPFGTGGRRGRMYPRIAQTAFAGILRTARASMIHVQPFNSISSPTSNPITQIPLKEKWR